MLRIAGDAALEPHDARAEHDLLWFSIVDIGRRKILLQNVRRSDFYLPEHAETFDAIKQLDDEGATNIDVEMVASRLRGPRARDSVRTPAASTWYPEETFDRHLIRLRQLSDCRVIQTATLEVAALGLEASTVVDPETYMNQAAARVSDALQARESRAESKTLPQLAEDFANELVDPSLVKRQRLIKIPLRAFKNTVSHFEAGRMYVLAGRPAMGKSALGVQLAYMIAERDAERVLIYSLEMSPEEIRDRCIAALSGVPLDRVTRREFYSSETAALMLAAEKLSQTRSLEIVDAAKMTLEDIVRHLLKEHAKERVALVVIDYLQLLSPREKSGSREEDVATISRTLKLTARGLSLAMVAVAQLNREAEKRTNKRPQMSDLRESGAIEQDADVIMFVYREGVYNDAVDKSAAEVIVAKNRIGPPGMAKLRFSGELTWFQDEVSCDL